MPLDEFDRFLSEQHPENADNVHVITDEEVTIVLNAVQSMCQVAMGNLNQINISLTRVQPAGGYVWSTTVHGVPLMVDTFEELIFAMSRQG